MKLLNFPLFIFIIAEEVSNPSYLMLRPFISQSKNAPYPWTLFERLQLQAENYNHIYNICVYIYVHHKANKF